MTRAQRIALLLLALSSSFCSGSRNAPPTAVPGHGAIRIEITPNPIMATRVSGDTYDFPFEVSIREIGGRPVEITRVSADVFALGGIRIGEESYDAGQIRALGYSTSVPANSEVRYRFAPRRSVPDDRLFSSVSAEVRVEGRDDSGAATTANTSVTVRR